MASPSAPDVDRWGGNDTNGPMGGCRADAAEGHAPDQNNGSHDFQPAGTCSTVHIWHFNERSGCALQIRHAHSKELRWRQGCENGPVVDKETSGTTVNVFLPFTLCSALSRASCLYLPLPHLVQPSSTSRKQSYLNNKQHWLR